MNALMMNGCGWMNGEVWRCRKTDLFINTISNPKKVFLIKTNSLFYIIFIALFISLCYGLTTGAIRKWEISILL